MKSVNKVIVVGNCVADPEMKYAGNGTAVAKFRVATNESYTDKSGTKQDKSEFHSCTAWAKTAEIIGQYLKKGRQVYVEGSLSTSSWDDKTTGEKKYRTEIVVKDFLLLGKHSEASSESEPGEPF